MPDYFEVKQSSEFGRYTTATKNILAGDIIFEEYPFVVGPKANVPPVCLVCCYTVDGSENGPRCPKCRWPLCGNCIGHEYHLEECDLFVQNHVKFEDFESYEEPCLQLDCITPLRLLLAKDSDPKRWDEEVSIMEHHEMNRRNTDQWKMDHRNVVEFLHGPCKLNDRFTEDLIQQACGILQVNAFEGRTSFAAGCNLQCLFPKSAITAHSCVPNVNHSIYPSDQFKITVRATIDIKKGETLYTTYTNLMVGTEQRQDHLKSGKYFTCHCTRCEDPTELGTHFRTFKCNKCELGLILSDDPYDDSSKWKCSHCEFATPATSIRKVLSVIQAETDALQSIEFGPERLEKCEYVFRKYRGVFHPSHYLLTELRQNLIELYGRVEGYELQDLTDNLLEHKMSMCRSVLNVLNVLYPGKTRTRAMLLYDLHAPIVLSAKISYATGLIQDDELKRKLQEAISMLEESTNILEWEDADSVEYNVAQIGKQSLLQLKESVKSI
ncbi:SET domain-containing protein SmydA-8-like [Bradysia coprophila]|uniref:SET domain-containing protein SmydA-8-like n=1 Tax=Bradysia coprophila TaxID=38358 RepID=UPI00187D91ED|nr:SET domain-containing protein SmydA-8-like [Bradysia coprophila]XP_037035205.1 SET domain-containing protein SmydA-8-like [Bradysia coprophila]